MPSPWTRATPVKPLGGWPGAREAAKKIADTLTPRLARLWRKYRDAEGLTPEERREIEDHKHATMGYLCSAHQFAVCIANAVPTSSELDLLDENEKLRDRVAELERLLTLQLAAE